jgi:hypothetical protein
LQSLPVVLIKQTRHHIEGWRVNHKKVELREEGLERVSTDAAIDQSWMARLSFCA